MLLFLLRYSLEVGHQLSVLWWLWHPLAVQHVLPSSTQFLARRNFVQRPDRGLPLYVSFWRYFAAIRRLVSLVQRCYTDAANFVSRLEPLVYDRLCVGSKKPSRTNELLGVIHFQRSLSTLRYYRNRAVDGTAMEHIRYPRNFRRPFVLLLGRRIS